MIRQAINCDICAAEKQASNYWFVAYEQAGELKVRGWEPTKSARKNAMHLCGQKCAQRMMANFMTSLMANSHGSEQSKDAPSEVVDAAAGNDGMQVAELSERLDRSHRVSRTDRSLVDGAAKDLDSWAGPVRQKEDAWETQSRLRSERESYLNTTRAKTPGMNPIHRMV